MGKSTTGFHSGPLSDASRHGDLQAPRLSACGVSPQHVTLLTVPCRRGYGVMPVRTRDRDTHAGLRPFGLLHPGLGGG